MRLKVEKCDFAQREAEWLGFKLSPTAIKPIDEKIQAITNRIEPKGLKELRSFTGSIYQMNRFIPNLASFVENAHHYSRY